MARNEADTRADLIDPKLNRAGWTRSKVTREHYYRPDWIYTAGRVILRGGKAERLQARKIDYLLRYTESFPIAVVEAKDEEKAAVVGLEQAKEYARDNGLMFAYTTNGQEIIEWDGFTNTTREIEEFPSPTELWQRWSLNTGIEEIPDSEIDTSKVKEIRPKYDAEIAAARRRNPVLHPYAPTDVTRGKTPRYFQEVAIREVLMRIIRNQQRILLTMATGTGKTFTAFQIIWKLIKSGWLYQRNQGRPGRILFIADRVVLRDQAYNTFGPFATSTSDPRLLLDDPEKLSLNRDLYFAIYQTLWHPDKKGEQLFKKFPSDFFDLIIIDEAHRSGFGTWNEILEHFDVAIHLGMTATPKQSDNIDTYEYFCKEEPAIPVDPDDDSKGSYHPPAYSYSLGQGIEDGFLATYKVHQIKTNIDKHGLHISEVKEQGAEVFVPEGAELREDYHTPQYERDIEIPDRTKILVDHLVKLLRQFGPMHKTMVFCVRMEHAQEVARQLNNAFADLGYGENYAVPIVSEEGEQGRRWLKQFQDSDKALPVVATTAELLSTGVDVPSARNIVFMKTVSSPIVFKQIIGRGTRIDSAIGKLWFRIIDYTNATRLLDPKWDKPPSPIDDGQPKGKQTANITGTVRFADTGDLLIGANVAIVAGPNDQRGPILTDEDGRYLFTNLPAGNLTIIGSGPKLAIRQLKIQTEEGKTTTFDFELSAAPEKSGRIKVKGLEVTIAEEATFIVDGINEPLTLEQYLDYSRNRLLELVPVWDNLQKQWQKQEYREQLQHQLNRANVYPEVIAEVWQIPDADPFDVLSHLGFERQILTRPDRANIFREFEQEWLNQFTPPAKEVVDNLLIKYEIGGLNQITDPQIFRVSPFQEMGELRGVVRRFDGNPKNLRKTIDDLQERLYQH